jgi:hypothetical protein
VKTEETRELIWLVPTEVFADLLLLLVTLRFKEHATRTAGMYLLTGLRYLADSHAMEGTTNSLVPDMPNLTTSQISSSP